MLKRTALPIVIVLTVAACSGGAAGPSPSPSPGGAAATTRPTPTAVPGQGGTDGSGGGGTDPGAGGGTDGNPGTGVLPPGITFPLPPAPDQALLGDANYLEPVDGLLNVRPVNVQLVRAAISSEGDTFVDLRWWSGVEACNQLASVEVARDDTSRTVRLIVKEGSPAGDQMCIELAELHATAVNLGVLEAGAWTISAEGDAPAIKLDVP